MLSVTGIPVSEYPFPSIPMSETNGIEDKLREILTQVSERSPESFECVKIESAILHIARMYSRTVAILLNLNDADPDSFSASYGERDA